MRNLQSGRTASVITWAKDDINLRAHVLIIDKLNARHKNNSISPFRRRRGTILPSNFLVAFLIKLFEDKIIIWLCYFKSRSEMLLYHTKFLRTNSLELMQCIGFLHEGFLLIYLLTKSTSFKDIPA